MRAATLGVLAAIGWWTPTLAAPDAKLTPEQKALVEKYNRILDSLHPQFGDIHIAAANATLHLGKAYYFLPPDEAKRVLVEGWENPPMVAEGVLGMIFPAGSAFVDDTWGAVIRYDAVGYVPSTQNTKGDYDRVLKAMQDSESEVNERRRKDGAPAVHIAGWAQPPSFDTTHHTAIWATDIEFAGETVHTLNYDVRTLGRRGTLDLDVISVTPKLPEIRNVGAAIGKTATFDPGSRYEDYDPKVDQKTEYGIAGLIAAGAGVALAKKFGLLALIAVFAKKAFVLIAAGFAAAVGAFKRLFRKKSATQAAEQPPASDL